MHPELQSALDAYRSSRCFDPERYLQAKSSLINAYFTQSGISGCVVGVSGGVDSAVTLGIIAHAARQPGSPIRRILALLLPMHGEGATHQDTASSRGAEVAAAFGVPSVTVDLSSTLTAAREASVASTGIKGTAWASGQLVSYLRTPMLYYQTALLTEQGFRSIACGTTNRDEGSYIGFFGKASDWMYPREIPMMVHVMKT
jgi:NAD+ synthase (glutamine-hydrolysing)